MIAMINLVNIHHHTELHIFFLVVRTSKLYSLGNFQICNTVLLTIVTILTWHPQISCMGQAINKLFTFALMIILTIGITITMLQIRKQIKRGKAICPKFSQSLRREEEFEHVCSDSCSSYILWLEVINCVTMWTQFLPLNLVNLFLPCESSCP